MTINFKINILKAYNYIKGTLYIYYLFRFKENCSRFKRNTSELVDSMKAFYFVLKIC